MIIRELAYQEKLDHVMNQLPKGAFLTVKSGETVNVMTAGWCMAGYMWNRPVFQILVRTSRHTYEMLGGAKDFTVSFPPEGALKKELAFCGSRSGRDLDKAAACGLTPAPAQKVDSPIISECKLHYECRIIANQKLPVEQIDKSDDFHEENDGHYHEMFYGEIVSCYMTDG